MKTLFIPLRLNLEIDKENIKEISKKLPKNLVIAYSIQYQNYAKEIRELLQKNHKIKKFVQVLGCSKIIPPKNTKAILLISDGKFHAVSIAFESKLPVYLLENNKLKKISYKEIEDIEKKLKASYINYLNADKIGILISTKSGQERLKKALQIRNKIKNKEFYLFLANNINIAEFDNFYSIQSWINTACPRLDLESNKIINIDKIK